MSNTPTFLVSRYWRGVTRRSSATSFLNYLLREGFPSLRDVPGFIDASIEIRDLEGGVQFEVVTEWESLEAIVAFKNGPIDVAVLPDKIKKMMVTHDRSVRHYFGAKQRLAV